MAALVLEGLTKRFGKTIAVNNLSLSVQEKEFFVIYGASGAGKTTTLKLVAGLEPPTSGQIYLEGRRIDQLEPEDRNVAMTFESYALFPHYTVYENLANPLRSPRYRMDPKLIDQRVRTIAEMLGIAHILQHRPSEISGGQKQRVSLGRSMVRQPRLFLFDEPLTHVDAKVRHRMRAELHRLATVLNTTTVYVTHDYAEALSLGDRIALIDHGALVQLGTPRELYDYPRNVFVAQRLGQPEINLLPGVVRSSPEPTIDLQVGSTCQVALHTRNGRIPAAGPVQVGVRPQDFHLSAPERGWPGISGEVMLYEPLGTKGVLTLRCGDHRIRLLTPIRTSFHRGENVRAWLDPTRLKLFDVESSMNLHYTGRHIDSAPATPAAEDLGAGMPAR